MSMNRHDSCSADALAELRSTLDQLASGLTTLSLDQILASEQQLAWIVPRLRPRDLKERPASLSSEDLEHLRSALRTCRRLGASLSEMTQNLLEIQAQQPGYAADGRGRLAAVPSSVQARV
jgi:hypothetical protein